MSKADPSRKKKATLVNDKLQDTNLVARIKNSHETILSLKDQGRVSSKKRLNYHQRSNRDLQQNSSKKSLHLRKDSKPSPYDVGGAVEKPTQKRSHRQTMSNHNFQERHKRLGKQEQPTSDGRL